MSTIEKSDSTRVSPFIETGPATAILPARHSNLTPITVIGTEAIRNTFDAMCITQALNSREAPGVEQLVLNPDAHCGYGAPIGCVLVSPTHIYPGPVGVDIKCSMSLLQTSIPADAINDVRTRRALINAILERIPTGAGKGQRSVKKSRRVNTTVGKLLATHGASKEVCEALGIPPEWATRCEDSHHVGHNGTADALALRLDRLFDMRNVLTNFENKIEQLGSYGGGNHFGEAEIVHVRPVMLGVADVFGLKNNHVAFLSHCGSRGFGYQLASHQFRTLQEKFRTWSTPFPGNDKELVYAPLGTPEADNYIDDMSLGANFATVNHMLINALVLEAFQEVLPGTTGNLVYFISHNIARQEPMEGNKRMAWVHRKGATRALPAHHHHLRGTPFEATGHPILLPGNPQAGSSVMVASQGAAKSAYSVNHGAGRMKGRKAAIREFDQKSIDQSFTDADILTNCRQYPKDEAPAAYKDFNEVLKSVEQADLAQEVARLKARFVIKDTDKADD
ncbi:MAG TPA: RtcB family protein [Phycisphaerae bacterium]|nr:RtcB family protein [Phycisphaerae bacterium]